MSKNRHIGLIVFGWIFIGLGLLVIVGRILCFPKVIRNLIVMISMSNVLGMPLPKYLSYGKILYGFLLSIAIFFGLTYFICGMGILRLKSWARYLIITLMATYIISIPNKGLFLGWQSLSIPELLIKIIIPSFVLWFFIRRKTKSQFQAQAAPFKLKSGYGFIICIIIFLALLFPSSLLLFKAYSSLRYKQPFFNIKLQMIRLREIDDKDF